ncbi:MAG: carboxypeptidase-like regulatory domain-containing protein, partial [Terriglobia bacterium]
MNKYFAVLMSALGILIAGLAIAPRQLPAQEYRASLSGQITDPSGAVIPNATVTAVMNSTRQTYTAKT